MNLSSPAGKAPHAIDCFANRNMLTNKPYAYNNCNGITLVLAARAAGKRAFLATFIAMDKSSPGRAAGSAHSYLNI